MIISLGEKRYRCDVCNLVITTTVLPITCCNPNAPPRIKGPGDYLHDAILKWVGEGPTRECHCKDRIAKMNAWGPAGCREHLEEIIEWMMGEAQKRAWWKVAVAAPILPRIFIRQMIIGAIADAEKATSTQ
jgi:hypothetical protein